MHTLLDLVHHALGIAIVPRPIAAKDKAAGLRSRELPGPAVQWQAALALGDDQRVSPAAAELSRAVRAALGSAAAAT